MIVLSGADLVLPGRIQQEGTLAIEGDRIADIRSGPGTIDLRGHIVVPGFVDVHVHGVDGIDTLDGGRMLCVRFSTALRHFAAATRRQPVCCPPISKAISSTLSIVARSRWGV